MPAKYKWPSARELMLAITDEKSEIRLQAATLMVAKRLYDDIMIKLKSTKEITPYLFSNDSTIRLAAEIRLKEIKNKL